MPEELIDALAQSFWKHADAEAIRELARSRPFPEQADLSAWFDVIAAARGFRVAYAQDEAFGRYFPDTLEALEALGAELVEFSPLRDERLPDRVDLVMIGCGYPDHDADLLVSNVSMIASLREHVCRGRRIYSEGGGTAYLGRRMVIDGRRFQGAGILPFEAELLPDPKPPVPVTRVLLHDCWLGPAGTVVRGYQSGRWRLTPSVEPFECPLVSEHFRPKEIGFTTITPSAVCSIFIWVLCRKSSTPSSAHTPRHCGGRHHAESRARSLNETHRESDDEHDADDHRTNAPVLAAAVIQFRRRYSSHRGTF